jgi:anti-sigma-K factor RskA
MEHRELQDLIPAHALDALDPDDAHLLEGHIETCEECRRELDDMRETTALLAFATDPVEPPASLRASILDAVAPPAPARSRSRLRLAFLRGSFAGALAVAAVALVIGIALHSSSGNGSRSAEVRVLTGTAQGAVVQDGGSSKLVVLNLKSAGPGHTYEAWLIGADGKPVPAGTFAGGSSLVFDLKGNADKAKTVAITVEPTGGSSAPTTKPFASASLV